ncbi:MAG TPA: DUF4350 domain-containing protein [Candidatus Acidoferrum sp.]|nr:DUF4350 domain-containing protein [Candidatus Acidoferrum sp.]
MPAGIAASDRKILLIGSAVLFLLLTASVVLAPPDGEYNSIPSTYSGQPGGAEAGYLLLSQLHYSVKRWESSPVELEANPRSVALLILAVPLQSPSEKEKKALASFVEGGGHVLFIGANISTFFTEASEPKISENHPLETYRPIVPNRLARGAQVVSFQPLAYWGTFSPSQLALYGEPDFATVVSWKLGQGEILWWAGATPLTNAGITKDDNLTFFLNTLRDWSSGKPYEIYWDEYFHGQRSSLWSYVAKTSLVWGLLQIGVIAFALLFTFSRRSGPIYVPAEVSRLSPLEYVETLGGLYERAGAASSAVAISYQRFRSLLTRQLGLSSTTPDQELGQATEERLGWKESGVGELLLRAANASRAEKSPRGEALDLVQKLERNAARLTIRPRNRKEKM